MNWYVNNMRTMKIVNKRTNEFMNKYLAFYVKNIEQSAQTYDKYLY